MNPALLQSGNTCWATPWDFFQRYDAQYHFTLDVCAQAHNAKCARHFSPQDDGLAQSWAGERCWMNPPYGREIGRWVEKARREAERGALVVGLLPARTDTQWFHEHVLPVAHVVFLRGRIRFVGAAHPAPFPSMLAIWGEYSVRRP